MKLFQFILLISIFSIWSCDKNTEQQDIPDPEIVIDIDNLGISDVPVFFIDTKGVAIPNEPKIPATYTIKVNGEDSETGFLGIELRGSTSRRLFEKKSYGLETWDENNEDINAPLLGFPEEEDWILHGPYADKTLIRNTLIYQLSNQIGLYAARTKFVEVVLNGEYIGVYAFMEKLKRDKERIDIKKLDPDDLDEEKISGGYILKIDKTSGDNENDDWAGDAIYTEDMSFRSAYDTKGQKLANEPFGGKEGEETYFLYEYPDSDDIVEAQKQYIQDYIQAFEDALIEADFTDSNDPRKYADYIDTESFAKFFILNELSSNPDAYRISTYLHKNRNEKLKMGPIWDFNLAFGLDGRSATNVWIYEYNERYPNDLWLVTFWWKKMLQDPIFKSEVKILWESYRNDFLSKSNISAIIEAQQAVLKTDNALARNFERWQVLGVELPFNSYVGKNYEEESNYLKDWISDRISWMDSQISNW